MSDGKSDTANPHEKDHCVVCGNKPTVNGPSMHPVASIEDGCVCQDCVDSTDTEEDDAMIEHYVRFSDGTIIPMDDEYQAKKWERNTKTGVHITREESE